MNVKAWTLPLIIAATSSVCFGETDQSRWTAAQEEYKNQKWQAAAGQFAALSKQHKEHPGLRYNLGCAYFRLKKYPKARAAFEAGRLLKPSKRLELKLLFNLGCVNFAEGKSLVESKPMKGLERLKSAIVNFRQVIKLSPKDLDAIHNLEFAMKAYSQAWKKAQEARAKKKADDQKKQQSKDLEKLKKDQEKLSQENKEEEQSQSKRENARKKQEQLSKKTKDQLDKMQKEGKTEDQGARESLKKARDAQKAAEEAMKKGDSAEAAKQQERAAKALGDAADQLKIPNNKEKGEAKAEESMAKEAKDALQQEKANKKRRAQLLRQLNRQGIKPVEKDW